MALFKDRHDAGQRLARLLRKYKGKDLVVYALPRGGVVLGAVVASELGAPLDIVVSRKVGHPLSPEYAVCAVSESGLTICNQEALEGIDDDWLENAVEKERQEAKRRRKLYSANRESISARGKTAVIVDDGVATGQTAQVAVAEIYKQEPRQLILSVPVIPKDTMKKFDDKVDKVEAVAIEDNYMGSVSAYFDDFPQVEDEEVIDILGTSR